MAKWSQDAKFKPSVPEFKSSRLVSIFLLFTDGSEFNFSVPLLNSGAGLLPASGDSYISFFFCFFHLRYLFHLFIQLESENSLCREVRYKYLFNEPNKCMDSSFLFRRCR